MTGTEESGSRIARTRNSHWAVLFGVMMTVFWPRASAQPFPVVHPIFEKHIVVLTTSCPFTRTTNTYTTSSINEPIAVSCRDAGAFNGTIQLQFPGNTPSANQGGTLDGPIHLAGGVEGTWTITNQLAPEYHAVTEARFVSSSCQGTRKTNGPPLGIGSFQVSASANCTRTNLGYVGVDGIDYIFQTQSEFNVQLVRPGYSPLNNLQVQVTSRYRAPVGPWLYVNTNQVFEFVVGPPKMSATTITQLVVNIGNFGTSDLNFTATPKASWLKLEATSGTLSKNGGPSAGTNFYARVEAGGLAPGTYTTTMEITANAPNGPKIVPVTLKVLTDTLSIVSVTPSSVKQRDNVRFHVNLEAQIETAPLASIFLYLYDQKTNRLWYTSEALRKADGLIKTNFFLPSPGDRETFIYDYITNLFLYAVLSDSFASRIMASNLVNIRVLPKDILSVRPLELNFNPGDQATESLPLTLRNQGTVDLDYTLSFETEDGGRWLSPDSFFGKLRPNEQQINNIKVFTAGLPPQITNYATITISGNEPNTTQTVRVQVLQSVARLVGFEAVQVVQDWNNSVPLLEGKNTTIRVHLQAMRQGKFNLTGTVFVYDQETLLGSIEPDNESIEPSLTAKNLDHRSFLANSLNFSFPALWRTGTVSFRVEGPGIFVPKEAEEKMEVTFEPPTRLALKIVNIVWQDAQGGVHKNDNARLLELTDRLRCLPVSSINLKTANLNWSGLGPPKLDLALSIVEWMRTLEYALSAHWSNRIFYGAIANEAIGGLGFAFGDVAVGNVPSNPLAEGRHTHAHEIGHNLGRPHAPFCEADSDPGDEPFPYVFENFPRLGPMPGTDDTVIFGYDHLTTERVISPLSYFDLMSYCRRPPVDRWPSKYTYEKMLDNLRLRERRPETATPDSLVTFVRAEIEALTGAVLFKAGITVQTVRTPPNVPAGEYILEAFNATGQVLSRTAFAPQIARPDGDAPPTLSFIIPLAANPEIRRLEVSRTNEVLGRLIVSSNPPTVRFISPNGGENLVADATTISWTASDPDGDTLSFALQYSPDNGTNWQTLVVDWPSTNYTIERSQLQQTTSGRIRVIASDGFQSAVDESDAGFTTAPNAPEPYIQLPFANELFVGREQIVFEAVAYDQEEGFLPETNIVWSSDRDGVLGSGSQIKSALAMSEGPHVITARATDTGGTTASTTVNITIARVAPPVIDPPRLTATVNEQRLVLSWVAGGAFVLQSAARLSTQISWNNVQITPSLQGETISVTLPLASGNSFYRLIAP